VRTIIAEPRTQRKNVEGKRRDIRMVFATAVPYRHMVDICCS
jgi:hypothetical protein